MTPHFRHPSEKPPTPAKSSKRARPNALRHAQVLPPHNVDLTLPPATHDLSKEAPADADASTKKDIRSR
jgi:hypothetical protein